jgi:hypothetical protein
MRTYKVTVDERGTIRWYNRKGEFHREDGPAIEYTNGTKYWCQNGIFHRENGPAVEESNGTKQWYLNGKEFTEKEFNTKEK